MIIINIKRAIIKLNMLNNNINHLIIIGLKSIIPIIKEAKMITIKNKIIIIIVIIISLSNQNRSLYM